MLLARLAETLLDWLITGRFPREEFRVHPALLVLLAIVALPVLVALALRIF